MAFLFFMVAKLIIKSAKIKNWHHFQMQLKNDAETKLNYLFKYSIKFSY